MRHRFVQRTILPAVLAMSVFITAAAPVSSQPALPSLADILEQVGDIEGLAPLSPILNPVSDLVIGLENLIDDLLADVPLINTLALGGNDAVDAGIAFSQATFPEGASTAILSREDLFADGFSSGGFQGTFDAPLLFTASGDLDPRTGAELQRLGMDSVTILGGETALNPLVVSKLQIAGLDVLRVGGPTRVETAAEAARLTANGATTAVLTRAYPDAGSPDSQAYADLLAAGPFAAENGWPILMTTSGSLHPAVTSYLQGSNITDVVIIGGEGAVSQAVEGQLGALGLGVDRIAGANRFATAVAIAEARGFTSSADPDAIILAEQGGRDDVWAPGFASSAFGDTNRAPVLLTDGPLIPAETLQFVLEGVPANLLDGGPAVVCAPFVSDIACRAVGLLMIGNLTAALDLIGGLLGDLPLIGDILAALGLADLLPAALQDLVDQLLAAGVSVDQISVLLGSLATGDAAALADALDAIADGLGIGLDDLLGGGDVDGVLDGDLIGDIVDGVVDGVIGGDLPGLPAVPGTGGLLGG
ncbi:hypothetical protein BH23ACT9_BH23ACT9_18340 [soil metagenome]